MYGCSLFHGLLSILGGNGENLWIYLYQYYYFVIHAYFYIVTLRQFLRIRWTPRRLLCSDTQILRRWSFTSQIVILVYTLWFGRVQRLLNGFDDYGNTCGVNNSDEELRDIPYANLDMIDKPLVTFFLTLFKYFYSLWGLFVSCE